MKIAPAPNVAETVAEGRTRDVVARSILESGPLTAAVLADRLKLSAAAIRRHLEALVTDGVLREVEPRVGAAPRGRGRPARAYALTDAGRASFGHAYDDLASTALRYLRETGGEQAVRAFADHRAETLAARIAESLRRQQDGVLDEARPAPADRDAAPETRFELVAQALTDEGYAANIEAAGNGVQLCQHHCPVAHVAAEFPELCEAETRALAQVLGTYVQRLATIARGDGVCTTHVPRARALAGPPP
ncbi:transcriptional regulator [Jatrophihabitans telluris]|uniref:Transcriptional regulator n=1 Tax=Jatrophihabitans telluris TaxID=2038343 RepID=A0ABY4R398_9ACTN|nr:metalloregulator ArsR/SmtB family transcription factor [Jatrophihabitans telluris]UQX90190.1 transcriptional regulator [Jatrophihabitans telluris]